MNRMLRPSLPVALLIGLTILAVFAPFLLVSLAGAAELSPTEVAVPWGQMIADHTDLIATTLFGIVLYMVRLLPRELVGLLTTRRVEQLLAQAIAYGCNAVAGATRDRVLTVDLGSAVVAEALRYAIAHGPAWLIRWMGGPGAIAEKIWSRLNLDKDASLPDLKSIAAGVAAGNGGAGAIGGIPVSAFGAAKPSG